MPRTRRSASRPALVPRLCSRRAVAPSTAPSPSTISAIRLKALPRVVQPPASDADGAYREAHSRLGSSDPPPPTGRQGRAGSRRSALLPVGRSAPVPIRSGNGAQLLSSDAPFLDGVLEHGPGQPCAPERGVAPPRVRPARHVHRGPLVLGSSPAVEVADSVIRAMRAVGRERRAAQTRTLGPCQRGGVFTCSVGDPPRAVGPTTWCWFGRRSGGGRAPCCLPGRSARAMPVGDRKALTALLTRPRTSLTAARSPICQSCRQSCESPEARVEAGVRSRPTQCQRPVKVDGEDLGEVRAGERSLGFGDTWL